VAQKEEKESCALAKMTARCALSSQVSSQSRTRV